MRFAILVESNRRSSGVIALSILPGIYAIEAGIDRVILRQAIDYVYSPNYRTDTRFTGNTALVASTVLSNLPASKRTPCLHFIVDRSAGSHLTNYSFAEVIRA